MSLDVIVSWPRTCDYPAWRQWIRDNRERFGRVIAVFTDHAGPDYREWLRNLDEGVEFRDAVLGDGRDWRDAAVNAALDISTAPRVWFTEQDFDVGSPEFWRQVQGRVAGVAEDGGRPLHPACIFADRELIERTSRYFGTPPVDHFWTFGTELAQLTRVNYITRGFRHWQATSESQMRIAAGLQPTFHPEQFREWVTLNLAVDVPLHPDWKAVCESWLQAAPGSSAATSRASLAT